MIANMMPRLAFMTLGVLHEPVGTPKVQGFVDRIAGVYGAADSSSGFLGRSERDVENWSHSWGQIVRPNCIPEARSDDRLAMTLSLWESLESVAAFAYSGAHGEALSKRKEWFESGDFPTYVAWWVLDDHQINWADAASRLDHLHEFGSSPSAFTFAKPFGPDGNPYTLDRHTIKAKSMTNA